MPRGSDGGCSCDSLDGNLYQPCSSIRCGQTTRRASAPAGYMQEERVQCELMCEDRRSKARVYTGARVRSSLGSFPGSQGSIGSFLGCNHWILRIWLDIFIMGSACGVIWKLTPMSVWMKVRGSQTVGRGTNASNHPNHLPPPEEN